eukprot:5696148-Prymnesium_polylepis.4
MCIRDRCCSSVNGVKTSGEALTAPRRPRMDSKNFESPESAENSSPGSNATCCFSTSTGASVSERSRSSMVKRRAW